MAFLFALTFPLLHCQICNFPPLELNSLLDISLALKVLALDEIGDVVLVLVVVSLGALDALAALWLQRLVRFGELAERGQRVRAELVQDAWDELREVLVLAVAVDCKGVAGDGGVDCVLSALYMFFRLPLRSSVSSI